MSLITPPTETLPERSFRHGALAGLGAGLIMTLAMIVLRLLMSTISLPEVLAEWSVEITPGRVFSEILGVLEAYAKPIFFVTLLITQVILGGAFGILYTLILEPCPSIKSRGGPGPCSLPSFYGSLPW